MLRHIVIYKLKDNSPQVIEEITQRFMSMKGKISVLRDIQCGADILHTDRSFDFALECTFDDLDALNTYTYHPVHLPVKEFMGTVAEVSKTVDYVIADKT